MNPNDPYVQTLASLQRIGDEVARCLVDTDDPAETERLRAQLGTVRSAVQRLNALADRYEPATVHEFALTDGADHRTLERA